MSKECNYNGNGYNGFGIGNCCCNFPTLVILILIILQFNRRRRSSSCGKESTVDNSILFIIALFYLSCCNPCRNLFGSGCGN
ncbi:hypothetical protein [Clostridium omnivorum]|uniref:hypothetical protein n=1 Tax=Clostridium omnivorum TaxID=1604902 RepID=UPI002231E885|nr:hypothetical protein [Clostridium sp. E14]